MSKSSHFTGQAVNNQVIKILDKEGIIKISHFVKGSAAYVKRIGGYKHLIMMWFRVLKHFDSLCEFDTGMKAEAHKLQHLGLNYLVRRST